MIENRGVGKDGGGYRMWHAAEISQPVAAGENWQHALQVRRKPVQKREAAMMIVTKTPGLVLSLLVASVSWPAMASGEVMLKGIYIGMPEQEYMFLVPGRSGGYGGTTSRPSGSFTLADIRGWANAEFKDGVLVFWAFEYGSSNHEQMRDALQSKYPLKCNRSVVQNNMGASFDQESCNYASGDSLLTLDRYSSNINESSLLLASREYLREAKAARKQRGRGDL